MKDSRGVEYIPGAGGPRLLKGVRVYLNAAGEAHFVEIKAKDERDESKWLMVCPHCSEPYLYKLSERMKLPDECQDACMRDLGAGEFAGICQHGERLYGKSKRCFVNAIHPSDPDCEAA